MALVVRPLLKEMMQFAGKIESSWAMRNPWQALRSRPKPSRAVVENNVVEVWTRAFASFRRRPESRFFDFGSLQRFLDPGLRRGDDPG